MNMYKWHTLHFPVYSGVFFISISAGGTSHPLWAGFWLSVWAAVENAAWICIYSMPAQYRHRRMDINVNIVNRS